MGKVETNVLIIGKSGVGKSSLLNYLFNKPIQKTGTGKPVTEEGVFPYQLDVSNGLLINVYDTWGLEPNKAEIWKKLILDEVDRHDCENVTDWFHTIFYCLSAKSARVEEFETEIIRELKVTGNNVIIVLTNCDVDNIERISEAMSKELVEKAGVSKDNIIQVCSVSKKLLGGHSTMTFGKERILEQIKRNLWLSICEKIAVSADKYACNSLDTWYHTCENYLSSQIRFYNYNSTKKYNKINNFASDNMKKSIEEVDLHFKIRISEACQYYNDLSGKFNLLSTNILEPSLSSSNLHYSKDALDKVVENIATAIISLIPLVIFFIPAVRAQSIRDEILSQLKHCKENTEKQITQEIDRITSELKKMRA